MKAIVQDRYGSADVLQLREVEQPEIGDDEVLVRVHAGGVDRGVWHLMTGVPYLMRVIGFGFRAPKDPIRGTDFAGRVEVVGKDVASVRVGDEVFGECNGSYAEYARVHQDKLASKPANLSFEQAAAVPTSAVTALQGLRDHAKVQPGQRVLVIGASGGVGTFAVQLAKVFGAEVTGVCSTRKIGVVQSAGADHVVDYTQGDFTESGTQYDVILDIAGNRPLRDLRRVLTPTGTLVIVGGEDGGLWFGGLERQLGAMILSPLVRQSFRMFVATMHRTELQHLGELVEAGKISPIVDRTVPLPEAANAIRYMEDGHAQGKVVVAVR